MPACRKRRRAATSPGRFSFNVKGGRCEACQGDGVIKIEMHFLPDVYVTCDTCKGKRYNRETLEVLFKGKSIADVLDMTVEEAADFFKAVPRVRETFQTLQRVGLGYIHVGQQATTLSGGEAQRVKLAKELSKRATGRTLYILDEPTTGLHFHDVAKLLEVLHELVDQGNSVVVIEHNLEVIKTADWVIDLGPEGGDGGGEIVAWGPPEDIAKAPRSYTGKFLKPVLKKAASREDGGAERGGGIAIGEVAYWTVVLVSAESPDRSDDTLCHQFAQSVEIAVRSISSMHLKLTKVASLAKRPISTRENPCSRHSEAAREFLPPP